MAQMARRVFLRAENRIRSYGIQCGICGGQNGNVVGSYQSILVFTCQL
jgi:hypothetical protein